MDPNRRPEVKATGIKYCMHLQELSNLNCAIAGASWQCIYHAIIPT
jgi:hypothetical protein